MPDVAFQVRIEEGVHRAWRIKAAELGFSSVAGLVRAAVDAYPHGGTPGEQVAAINSTFKAAGPATIICPAATRHRKGAFCKSCSTTPTKDGE